MVTRIFRPVGGVKFRQSEEGVVGWEHQGLPGAMQVHDGGSPVVTMSPWVSICFSTEWFNSMFNFDDLGEAGHLHILHLTKPSTIDKTYHIIRSWEKKHETSFVGLALLTASDQDLGFTGFARIKCRVLKHG